VVKRIRSEEEKIKIRARSKIRYHENPEIYIQKALEFRSKVKLTVHYRVTRMLSSAKTRAKLKQVPFNITYNYLLKLWYEQNEKCCISGITFDFSESKERVNKYAPSLDRIIPELGYTEGNVRFVIWQVNAAISEYGIEAFLELCKNTIEFNKGIL
jgi:hypothetical protein